MPTVSEDRRLAPDPRAPLLAQHFARDGYVGPIRLLTPAECRSIAAYLHRARHPAPADWMKGRAVHERVLYDLAVHPTLLALVTTLLGDDVVLWGASAVTRGPGDIHPWHSDIESCDPAGRFATVWIGLEHTSRESALQVISRSHRLGKSVQEVRAARGLRRDEATPAAMLEAARQADAEAALVQPDMGNGDAIVFDGRLWHGSDNGRRRGRRLALLLQYAAADCAVRIPDFSQLDWPFRLRAEPRPPVILMAGTDRGGANRLVPAPPPSSQGVPMVATAIHPLVLPLEGFTRQWQPFPAFHGPTRSLADMSCHASLLAGGHSPHPPHAHCEEEILLPLHGEVEVLIADSPTDPVPRVERMTPGSFVYYPAWQHHTIRNPGTASAGPVAYLMFKWYAAPSQRPAALQTGIVHHGDVTPPADAPPFWTQRLFEGPTGCLGKLHAHLTVLQPGAGYAPHVDAYDVAIVLLSGTVETLGQRVDPMSVIYYAAGELHGMRNAGTEPARYLVFEFHAPGVEVAPELSRTLPARALRFGKRVARAIGRRVKRRLPVVRLTVDRPG